LRKNIFLISLDILTSQEVMKENILKICKIYG
jgi:hypothetical protein